MDDFDIDRLEAVIRGLRERSMKLDEVLGVNIILECGKAVEKALDVAVKTGSLYDAKTYAILASPPAGDVWAYRCSRDRPVFIEVCKGDKYISITYDNRVKAVVSDAVDSLFCIKRGEYHGKKRGRKRGKR